MEALLNLLRRPRLQSARPAVSALFFINGVLFSRWVSRIPAIPSARGLGHVAMNAKAITVQHHFPRPIMSSFNALVSTSGLVGVSFGAMLALLGPNPLSYFTVVATVLGLAAFATFQHLTASRRIDARRATNSLNSIVPSPYVFDQNKRIRPTAGLACVRVRRTDENDNSAQAYRETVWDVMR